MYTYSSAVTAALLLLMARGENEATGPRATVQQGDMLGTTMTSRSGNTFAAFLGIPFAEPPVGELRFKDPQPPKPWDGVLNATKDGSLCIQKNYLDLMPTVEGQEDCLYLNVYTADVMPKELLDVMVYIHGGGFFSGTGASTVWGPQYLLDKDIVLVTFNYRLGPLGFLSTGDCESPGNYGFKDQVAALKWVQNNIAALGGNPNSVTLFGQSAGASSVHLQMLSPLSAGLFHRAISESGSAMNAFAWPIDSQAIAKRQALFVGCNPDDTSAAMVKCLRGVDSRTLVDSGDNFKFWSVDPLDVFGPAIEEGPGAFLTANPFHLVKTGQFHHVPWITGVVTDEGILRAGAILANETLLTDLNRRLPVLGPRLFELNKSVRGGDEQVDYVWDRMTNFFMQGQNNINRSNRQGFLDMYTDRSFIHAFHKSALLHQGAGHKDLFLYHFNYRGQFSFSTIFTHSNENFGICHCDDLIYLFKLFPDWPAGHPDRLISDQIIELWINFAKFGHPTPDPSKTIWEPVSPGEHLDYLEISAGPTLTMKQDLFKQRMEFWDSLPLVENEASPDNSHYLYKIMYNVYHFLVYLMD